MHGRTVEWPLLAIVLFTQFTFFLERLPNSLRRSDFSLVILLTHIAKLTNSSTDKQKGFVFTGLAMAPCSLPFQLFFRTAPSLAARSILFLVMASI